MKVVNGECPGGWSRGSPGARGTRCGPGWAELRRPEVPADIAGRDKRHPMIAQPLSPRFRTARLPGAFSPQLRGQRLLRPLSCPYHFSSPASSLRLLDGELIRVCG